MKELKKIVKDEVEKILWPIPNYGRGLYSEFMGTEEVPVLTEGIFRTYPAETAVSYIKKLFGIDDNMIRIVSSRGSLPEEKRIQVLFYDDYGNRDRMKKAMGLCGYVLSKGTVQSNGYAEEIYIPIQQPDLNGIVRQFKFITHISPQYFRDKILKNGFIPKSTNTVFSYPDRVFFFRGNAPFEEMLFQAFDFDKKNKKKQNSHVYTFFNINTKKIPEGVKFHTDLTYPFGIYTNDNVPPNCIEAYRDLDLKELSEKFLGSQ